MTDATTPVEPWVCTCFARSAGECFCGAWDVPVQHDPPASHNHYYGEGVVSRDNGVSASADRATHEPNPQAVSAVPVGIADAEPTPGPWLTNCSHIYAPDGAIIATVNNPGSRVSDYPLVANRNLMASAPELLAALEEAIATSDRLCAERGWVRAEEAEATLARMRAAISKARTTVEAGQ